MLELQCFTAHSLALSSLQVRIKAPHVTMKSAFRSKRKARKIHVDDEEEGAPGAGASAPAALRTSGMHMSRP